MRCSLAANYRRCFVASGLAASIAGCSGGTAGPPLTPVQGATATPTISPSPTASATAPASPSPSPAQSGAGVAQCIAPTEPVPGTYTSISTNGFVSGSTYTQAAIPPPQSGANTFEIYDYEIVGPTPPPTNTPNPNPTPSPTASPVPSGSPTAVPIPTPSPAPYAYREYFGTYSIPGFSGIIGGTSTPFAASATTGCFEFSVKQTTGGAPSAYNAAGGGGPIVTQYFASASYVTSGTISSLTISNLTETSGTGSFTLQNGIRGTLVITGSDTGFGSPFVRRTHAGRSANRTSK